MLKFQYATAAEIPEAHKNLYVERDGKWFLNVDGAVSAEAHAEFRQRNTDLQKTVEAIVGKVTGKPLDEFRAIKGPDAIATVETAVAAHIDAAKKVGNKEVETEVEKRVGAMKTDYEGRITKLTETTRAQESELSKLKIDSEVLKHGGEFGLRSTANDDLLNRARGAMKIENGQVVVLGPDGKQAFDSNAQPMTIKAWVGNMAKDAAHLFEPSTGAGSKGGGQGGGGGGGGHQGPNPWEKGANFNLTKQGELYTKDPALARKMAAQHGVSLP